MTWALKYSYKYEAVEVVKETTQMVFYIDRGWGKPRERRIAKGSFLPWRGSEDDARALAVKLMSAAAEYDRRRGAASEWFKRRRAEILASADTHPEDGDSTQIEAPLVSGAVPLAADAQKVGANDTDT